MSTYMQYSMAATEEALKDADWQPKTDQELQMTVSIVMIREVAIQYSSYHL